MLKFNKTLFLTLVALIAISCQGTQKHALEPVVAKEPAVDQVMLEPQSDPKTAADYNSQFYKEALIALKTDRLQFAIELLEQLAKDAPELKYLFTNLGLAYLKQNKFDEASDAFNQAILSNNNDAIAYNHLGIIKRTRGDFKSALETYKKAIDLDTKYASAYLNLGILYDIYLQKLDLALLQYKQYQVLTSNENESVASWIIDIERRIKSKKQG